MVSFRRLSDGIPVLSEGWADSLLFLYVGGAWMQNSYLPSGKLT